MSPYNLLKKADWHLIMKLKILLIVLFIVLLPSTASASVVYTGTHWDLAASGNDRAYGITMNDTYFWVVDTGQEVYQYHHNGTYTGTSWDAQSFMTGITMNTSYIWVVSDLNKKADQYHHNGTYTGTYWNITEAPADGSSSITMNASYFWVLDHYENKVYQYHHNGTYTGTSWSTVASGNSAPGAITMNDTYFWITDNSVNKVYQYHHNGTHTGVTFSCVNYPYGITMNSSHFWIVDSYSSYGTDEVYQYYINTIPITSALQTESQTNPTQIYTNTSTPYFNWTYTDPNETQYSWEIQVGTASGLSDMWNSGQLLGADTSDIYAGSTLIRNTTYYVQVRTNDSYETSSWETGTFKINALPVITNVVITPGAPLDTDDLTATNDTATDGNGDSTTIYHLWYKDDVLQPALNNIVTINSSNTTDDEVWNVGIIPNDGYENGTETFSGTVTIGSGNYVPTLTGISCNLTLRKYNKSVTITTSNAFDQNGDNYTLHIGSSSGASDICNSSSTANGTEASCSFLIPWTSGAHTIYGRLTDQNDTSIEYTEVITVDVTPPSIDSSSVSPASGTTDLTYQLSASISIANGSISSVNVCVGRAGLSCTNYTMVLSEANYIYNFSTGSAGSYVSTIYTTDDSGNSNSATGPSFTISTGSEGGGGGGATNITINETIIGDLTLTPPRLDTYAILLGDSMTSTYRFVANRHIESCDSEVGVCSITAGYIVNVAYEINQSTKYIEDNITVRDVDGYLAVSKVQYIRVIHLGSSIPIGEIHVGESLGNFLSVFFEVSAGILTGIKTWFLVSLVGALGYFGYKSYQ